MATPLKPVKVRPGEHPNSRANLVPFKKGENGNHQGYSLLAALKCKLNEPLQEPAADAPVRDHIVYSTLVGARLREPVPFREVWDRVEGKVSPEVKLSGEVILRIVEE